MPPSGSTMHPAVPQQQDLAKKNKIDSKAQPQVPPQAPCSQPQVLPKIPSSQPQVATKSKPNSLFNVIF